MHSAKASIRPQLGPRVRQLVCWQTWGATIEWEKKMLWDDALEGFWLEKRRNVSPHTVSDYALTFTRFREFVGGNVEFEDHHNGPGAQVSGRAAGAGVERQVCEQLLDSTLEPVELGRAGAGDQACDPRSRGAASLPPARGRALFAHGHWCIAECVCRECTVEDAQGKGSQERARMETAATAPLSSCWSTQVSVLRNCATWWSRTMKTSWAASRFAMARGTRAAWSSWVTLRARRSGVTWRIEATCVQPIRSLPHGTTRPWTRRRCAR